MTRSALHALVRDEIRQLDAYHVPRPRQIRAKLDANESPYSLPPEIADALGRELAAVELNRYPLADCADLRRIVASELGVGGNSLVFGNGSDELIALLISTFSRPRPGRERAVVVYPGPTFVVYGIASVWGGAEPVEVRTGVRFELDEELLDAAIADRRPNLVFFARPNNPTGNVWPSEAVLRVARENPDLVVVDDEAYLDYGGDSLIDRVADLPNLVVMRTLSKAGLAALRIGYLHAQEPICEQLEKVRPPYNIGALNQRAAAWLLENHRDLLEEARAKVIAERDSLQAALAALPGIDVFESQANLFLLRLGEPGDGRATSVWKALAERGVMVRNLDRPGPLSGCLRVTVGTPSENALLIEMLEEVLS